MHLSTYSHFRSNVMPMTNRSPDATPGHPMTLDQCCVGHSGCSGEGHTGSQILVLELHPSHPMKTGQCLGLTPGFPLKLCGYVSFQLSDKGQKSVLISVMVEDSGLREGRPFSGNLELQSEQGFVLTSGRPYCQNPRFLSQ